MFEFEEKEFVKNYDNLKSSRKMAELYSCDRKTITAYARKIGYDYTKYKTQNITLIPIEIIIQDYKTLGSAKNVGQKYQCSSTAVLNYLKQNNYQPENKTRKLDKVNPKDFVEDYLYFKNTAEMANKYQCSTTSIQQYAKKIGFNIEEHKEYKLTDEQKREILNAYYSTETSVDLAIKYNVSRGMITKLWYDHNLKGKSIKYDYQRDLTNQRFGKLIALNPTKKRSCNGSVIWNCVCDCGNYKEVASNELTQNMILSCGQHSISKGNYKIAQLLTENGILYETEKIFEDCKDKKSMPFDFYVNNSYLIEFDGSQHFKYTNTSWNTKEHYEYVVKHDQMKNEWAKQNNIPLIRIPYTQLNKLQIQDLLLETSNFII